MSAVDVVAQRLYEHVRHPHVHTRAMDGPVRIEDQLPRENVGRVVKFNNALAIKITNSVGTMWCAYVFALMDLVSLPSAIRAGTAAIVVWIAQTFLQLVLLSIIMVGQNIQGAAADLRATQTFKDVEALLHDNDQLHEHLTAQDEALIELVNLMRAHYGAGVDTTSEEPA